jgi:CTP synthase
VETVELSERPFHVGVQYHPEFKSRPNKPHPLFLGFVGAAAARASAGSEDTGSETAEAAGKGE